MEHVMSLGIILLFSLLGEILKNVVPLPIPASIYGMLLLFLSLQFKIIKVEKINNVAQYLISIMLIFFIIPAVSIMDSFDLLTESLIPILVIIILPTIVVVIITGRVTQRVETILENRKKKGKKHGNTN